METINKYKNIFLKWKYLDLFILLILFGISFLLRIYALDHNLFFGPEQGRDLLVIKGIVVDHKFTLIGPKTDISGIFHGPFFYYLSSLPFVLSRGDPVSVSVFYVFLSSLTVFPIYLLGTLFGNKRVGLLSAFIFTISFQSIVYARWLSNPPLSIPLSALYFVFLYRFIKGNKKDLLFASLTLGLLNQSEFLNIAFFTIITVLILLIYLYQFKKQNRLYLILCGVLTILISVGTYLFFDLKHNFLITKQTLLLARGDVGYHLNILQMILQTEKQLISAFTNTVLPVASFLPIVFIVVGVCLIIKKITAGKKEFMVLLIWLFTPVLILIVLRHGLLDQFFVSQLPLFILLTALVIGFVWEKAPLPGAILFVFVMMVNLSAFKISIPSNKNIFFQTTQPELKYADQKAVIKDIYKEAKDEPFYFQSYTIPYWFQDGWEYLFWYYGHNYYGYVPQDKNVKLLFVIIQDDPSNKPYQDNWLKNTVSSWGVEENEFRHGTLAVKRLRIK